MSVRVPIRRIGNSQGVLLPKPLLEQAGLEAEAELSVEDDAIILRRPQRAVRKGWAEASQRIAQAGDDTLAWPEFGNAGDGDLQW
jgi:antitoxin MazE